MKKKILYLVALMFIMQLCLWTHSPIVLNELQRPGIVEVGQDFIFIEDHSSVFIYSLKDFKLVKKVGKQGEGPREFKIISSIYTQGDSLVINSRSKISFFTLSGEFLREVRPISGSDFFPVQDAFWGMDMVMEKKFSHLTVNLYNSKLQKIKEISRRKGAFLGSKFLDPILIYGPLGPELLPAGERILVKGSEGKIKVFDVKGNLTTTIVPNYPKVKVSEKKEEEILEFYKTNPRTKDQFSTLKKRFKFPAYFPYIRDYFGDPGQVYVLTFKEQEGKKQLLVFDKEGKAISEIFIELEEKNILELFPLTIKDNKIYQLVDDLERENWILNITDVTTK